MLLQKRFHKLLSYFVIIILLESCGTPPASITPTLRSIPSLTPTATATIKPTSTSTPVPAPLTPTATPTATPTLAPTLTADQEMRFVIDMLRNNGGCELPCWWGITPSKTTWQATRDLFTSNGIKWFYENELHFDPPDSERQVRYGVNLYLVQQTGTVQSVQVEAEVFGNPQSNQFSEDWKRYSLDQVLTRYGKPSQVKLELANVCPEQGCGPAPYNLFVFYDDRGILVRYQGPAIRGDPIRACPSFDQVRYIELWLQSPEQSLPLLQMANLDPSELDYMRPLTETTDMSLEQFYKAFRNPASLACIDSPAKFWQ